ncbi:hypothetical protein BOO86_13710 [Mycobacterium sp. CBMA 234]|nr:hypothetical protein [Mycolicibacterium sp. CBMA 234]
MIAPVDVPNEFGLNAAKWLHITGFTMRPDLPFEELLRAARNEYESYSNPIYWVRDRIEQNFDAARAEMLSLG